MAPNISEAQNSAENGQYPFRRFLFTKNIIFPILFILTFSFGFITGTLWVIKNSQISIRPPVKTLFPPSSYKDSPTFILETLIWPYNEIVGPGAISALPDYLPLALAEKDEQNGLTKEGGPVRKIIFDLQSTHYTSLDSKRLPDEVVENLKTKGWEIVEKEDRRNVDPPFDSFYRIRARNGDYETIIILDFRGILGVIDIKNINGNYQYPPKLPKEFQAIEKPVWTFARQTNSGYQTLSLEYSSIESLPEELGVSSLEKEGWTREASGSSPLGFDASYRKDDINLIWNRCYQGYSGCINQITIKVTTKL